jgi:hypothetical protein
MQPVNFVSPQNPKSGAVQITGDHVCIGGYPTAILYHSSGMWRRVDSSVDTNVSEIHPVSIFKAEVAMLGSGWVYIESEEGKTGGVGQSGTRNEEGIVPG